MVLGPLSEHGKHEHVQWTFKKFWFMISFSQEELFSVCMSSLQKLKA